MSFIGAYHKPSGSINQLIDYYNIPGFYVVTAIDIFAVEVEYVIPQLFMESVNLIIIDEATDWTLTSNVTDPLVVPKTVTFYVTDNPKGTDVDRSDNLTPLSYTWYFDVDGVVDVSTSAVTTEPTVNHTYTVPGEYNATVCINYGLI